MRLANEMIHKLSQLNDNLHYIDIASPMLGPTGRPAEGLFAKDGLHLNAAGYRAWTKVISIWLEEHESGS